MTERTTIRKRMILAGIGGALVLAQASTPAPQDDRAMAIYSWLQNPVNAQLLEFINKSIDSQTPPTSSYVAGTLVCVSRAAVTAAPSTPRKPAAH